MLHTSEASRINADIIKANHVLHYFSPSEGFTGGSFIESLLKTYGLADVDNRKLLAEVYPTHAMFFDFAVAVEGGLDKVREIAKSPLRSAS